MSVIHVRACPCACVHVNVASRELLIPELCARIMVWNINLRTGAPATCEGVCMYAFVCRCKFNCIVLRERDASSS